MVVSGAAKESKINTCAIKKRDYREDIIIHVTMELVSTSTEIQCYLTNTP